MSGSVAYKAIEFALLAKIVSPEKVIEWADQQIVIQEKPEHILFDLCVAKTEQEQLLVLGGAEANHENLAFEFLARAVGEKYISGEVNFFEAANKLLRIYYFSTSLNPDTVDFLSWLDDETSLVADGVKDLSAASIELSKFFKRINTKHNK